MKDLPRRGEVWWCELPEIPRRPVVVLTRDAGIPRLGRVLIAPCTTTIRGLPSEVALEVGDDPMPRRSAINLDSLESVSVGTLTERLGRLSGDRMREVCSALAVAVDSPEERHYFWPTQSLIHLIGQHAP
ncbi:MAG: type II toxin-antitoxin system PemK/MazF family toxin [bacterium]